MENITVNILGCAIVFFLGFYAGIIYRRKNAKENFKPSHNTGSPKLPLCCERAIDIFNSQGLAGLNFCPYCGRQLRASA